MKKEQLTQKEMHKHKTNLLQVYNFFILYLLYRKYVRKKLFETAGKYAKEAASEEK